MNLSMNIWKRLASVVAAIGISIGGLMAFIPQAQAASTTCRTVTLSMWSGSIHAYMQVPICYNGAQVRQGGPITPGAGMIGGSYQITWHGSYDDSSLRWLGVGENFNIEFWPSDWGGTMCSPRWYFNVNGGVYGGSMNCA